MLGHFGALALALLAELGHETPIDHFILLGTAASIWDVLFEEPLGLSELLLPLIDRVGEESVDDALLQEIEPIIEADFVRRKLAKKVSLRTIPMGCDLEEQVALLQCMAQFAEPGDTFSMDVTHGFRSLPMLGLTCAMLLQQLQGVEILGLYYGALEMADEENRTPVVELTGLLRITQWLGALSAFNSSGDYGLFSHLLDDKESAVHLAQAGFLEKTMKISEARSHVQSARRKFAELADADPLFALFHDRLVQLTNWSDEPTYARRQLAAAENARRHRDYVRASSLAIEAQVSSEVGKNGNPTNFKDRQGAKARLNAACRMSRKQSSPDVATYDELNILRNSLVHGTTPTRNDYGQQSTLKERGKLERRLDELLLLLHAHMMSP